MGDVLRSRARRLAFAVALLVSAAIYAYSLVGIAATEGTLRAAAETRPAERATPVSYGTWDEDDGDCGESAGVTSRVRL